MTQFYNAEGNVIPVTVIQTGPCVVVQKKESATDGYNAIQVGFGSKKNQRVNKPEQGHMAKAGKGAFEVLKEFRLDDVSQFQVGQEIKAADLFKAGDRIDVSGTSKGHGFAGVIKRWSFAGFPGLTVPTNTFATVDPSVTVLIPVESGKEKRWPAIGATNRSPYKTSRS